MLNSIKKVKSLPEKKVFLVVLMFLFISGVHAQPGSGKPDDIEKVRTRKLIVVTEVPDEKVVKDVMKRKETKTLESYKAILTTYNEKMKAVVEKFWPWASNGIEYKTWAEVAQLRKEKNKDYAVLYCFMRSPGSRDDGMNQTAYLSRDDFNKGYNWHNCQMEVTLVEDFGRNWSVGAVRLPDILPTEMDLVFGIKSIEQYFNFKAPDNSTGKKKVSDWEASHKAERKMDVTKLKDKTLMIRKDLMGKDLTEDVIKQHYPYSFKICTREEIDEMCMNDKVPANTVVLLDYPVDDEAFGNNAVHANIFVYDLNAFITLTVVAENFVTLTEKSLKRFSKK